MIDPFGRTISYLRLSVTDRCDLRCTYCMPERMTFLPRAELLTLDELDRLAAAFIRKGVRKLRLTGGEPLVRKDVIDAGRGPVALPAQRRARRADPDHQRHPARGTMPPRSPAAAFAGSTSRSTASIPQPTPGSPAAAGSSRSIAGIDAALAAGLEVKINAVALRDDNRRDLVRPGRMGARPRRRR